MMTRIRFIQQIFLLCGLTACASSSVGCMLMVPEVSKKARDPRNGDPWQCTFCGYVTRSRDDISNTRCPRCMRKKMTLINEEDMQKVFAE